jgi:hypothetical protein
MASLNFVPEIWAKVILAALKKELVYGGPGVSNGDYEGEISGPGASVSITSFSDPSVSSYTQGSSISWTRPSDSGQVLNISQQEYAQFTVEDIDRRQAAGDFQDYLEDRMSYVLAQSADVYIATAMAAGVSGSNVLLGADAATASNIAGNGLVIAGATTSTSAAFYNEVVLPLATKLDDSLVPDDGNRFLVVAPYQHALLKQSPAFVSFGYDDVLLTGQLGTIDNFNVYKSQNAPAVATDTNGNHVVIAGHPMATTFAEQIVSVESLRLQDQFADGVRALHVYGAKVTRPTALAVAGVNRPAGM